MRLWLARSVWWVHSSVLVFLVFGWALPWRWALWVVAIGAPVTQLGWWFCENRCVLTIVEDWLRGKDPAGRPATEDDEGEPPTRFVAEFLERLIGRPVSERVANALSYTVVWGGGGIAIFRLANQA